MTAMVWEFVRPARDTGGRFARFVKDALAGIAEGRELAQRYHDLQSRSDSELSRLGLRREDIPRAVVLGRP